MAGYINNFERKEPTYLVCASDLYIPALYNIFLDASSYTQQIRFRDFPMNVFIKKLIERFPCSCNFQLTQRIIYDENKKYLAEKK